MNTKPLILLVDDDVRLARWLKLNLEPAGYKMRTAGSAEVAERAIERDVPDLIILDLVLPGSSGADFLRRLRSDYKMPVIMLTVKNDHDNLVSSLYSGADDYVTKPFNMSELLARIDAVMRRAREAPAYPGVREIKVDDLTINLGLRRVTVRGTDPDLTPTEYKLLAELAANPGQVLLHRELLTKVWGPAYWDEWEYIRTYINRLRRKIEVDPADPKYIMSKPGFGYYLRVPGQRSQANKNMSEHSKSVPEAT